MPNIVILQANAKEMFDDDDLDVSSGSDFDDDEDPDKIEVPGKFQAAPTCISNSNIWIKFGNEASLLLKRTFCAEFLIEFHKINPRLCAMCDASTYCTWQPATSRYKTHFPTFPVKIVLFCVIKISVETP